jgi:hypothetical protein
MSELHKKAHWYVCDQCGKRRRYYPDPERAAYQLAAYGAWTMHHPFGWTFDISPGAALHFCSHEHRQEYWREHGGEPVYQPGLEARTA